MENQRQSTTHKIPLRNLYILLQKYMQMPVSVYHQMTLQRRACDYVQLLNGFCFSLSLCFSLFLLLQAIYVRLQNVGIRLQHHTNEVHKHCLILQLNSKQYGTGPSNILSQGQQDTYLFHSIKTAAIAIIICSVINYCIAHQLLSFTHTISKSVDIYCNIPQCITHTYTHTHNCFTTLSILSGTTRVSQYQKKHSFTHTYHGHQSSLICFLHLLRSLASSLFN